MNEKEVDKQTEKSQSVDQKIAMLGELGNAFFTAGDLKQALDTYKQILNFVKESGNRQLEAATLSNLGNIYTALGEVQEGIDTYQRAMKIALEIGDRTLQGNNLGNLGLAYAKLGDIYRAIEFYQQALRIALEIGDRTLQGNALGNLALAFDKLGEADQYAKYYQEALQIKNEESKSTLANMDLYDQSEVIEPATIRGSLQTEPRKRDSEVPMTSDPIKSRSSENSLIGTIKSHRQRTFRAFIPLLFTILGAFLALAANILASSVIGNNVISQLISQIGKLWPWFFIAIIILAFLGVTIYLLLQIRLLKLTVENLSKFVQMDDSLLRLFASSVPSKYREDEAKRILTELLRDSIDMLGRDVIRASIFLPEPGGEVLTVWAQYGMPEESIRRTRFYIGHDVARGGTRGVAGRAFVESQTLVAHIISKDGQLKADHVDYVNFEKDRFSPPYRSFVAVPLIIDSFTSLGVVSFDSINGNTFDSSAIKVTLLAIARRIAAALLIAQKLS